MTFLVLLLFLAATPQKFREFFFVDDTRVPAKARESTACEVRAPDASVWTCAEHGVIRKHADGSTEHLSGQRYLPADRVTGIYVESSSRVWFKTAAGFSRVEYRLMTLEQKADYFERRIQERHDHEGFIRSSDHLGRLAPLDNDGLWTAIYIGAEAFRYAVTKSPEARQRAWRSMDAVIRLEEVTGIPGFPARAMIRKGEFRYPEGSWRPSPDGQFEWKSDTSSDELAGQYFAYAVYYDLAATAAEKPRIRATVSRITKHLIEHNYALIDWTGKPTTWAQYSTDYLKDHPEERALNKMLLLSHLLVAHHITGDPVFRKEYDKLIGQGYQVDVARYIETRLEINYSDEEMAMLGFYPLLQYEKDPALRKVYLKGLDEWWENEKREKNPWWIAIHDACIGAKENAAEGQWTLERIPVDLVEYKVENSWRPELHWQKHLDRENHRETMELIPADERRVMKWNGNPFMVDGGGDGKSEDDGSFYLLPYWMGRYMSLWR
jgi:hypothetical protein